jgi:hypothetical protein
VRGGGRGAGAAVLLIYHVKGGRREWRVVEVSRVAEAGAAVSLWIYHVQRDDDRAPFWVWELVL